MGSQRKRRSQKQNQLPRKGRKTLPRKRQQPLPRPAVAALPATASLAHQATRAPPPLPQQQQQQQHLSRRSDEVPTLPLGGVPWSVFVKGCLRLPCRAQLLPEITIRQLVRTLPAHALLEAALLCCGVGVAKRRLRAAGSCSGSQPLASGGVESGGWMPAWLTVHCRYEGFH